jgi:cell division protein ZapE
LLLSPLSRYRQLIDGDSFSPDPGQFAAVEALDELWHELQRQRLPGRKFSAVLSGALGKLPGGLLRRAGKSKAAPVKGLYLWGGVGRGKTWLMDLFHDSLPAGRKQRIHFHRFMQRVHRELRSLGCVQDPLPRIAADWATRCRVLCLDEFFVADIADAMLLAGLLENLFANGVTLVTTSNTPPDGLYRDGLQRARFLPAIELIKQHMRVLELPGTMDFRLRILEQSEIFHFPLDARADQVMTRAFERFAADCELDHDLDINGRNFHARRRGDGVIWFDFAELCEKPRGSIDYIEIARAFNTVVLSGVPQLTGQDDNAARRFIALVDEFYDRNVKLLMSAAVPLGELYTGQELGFEFRRTTSRLVEMQSHAFLSRPHLP